MTDKHDCDCHHCPAMHRVKIDLLHMEKSANTLQRQVERLRLELTAALVELDVAKTALAESMPQKS